MEDHLKHRPATKASGITENGVKIEMLGIRAGAGLSGRRVEA